MTEENPVNPDSQNNLLSITSPTPAPPQKKSLFIKFLIYAFIGFVVVYALGKCGQNTKLEKQKEGAIDCAKTLIGKSLIAPGSANYPEIKILDQKGDKFLVFATVDSQNAYGAMLRGSFLTVLEVTAKDPEHFTYLSGGQAVQKCSDPPEEAEIAMMKKLNQWPE